MKKTRTGILALLLVTVLLGAACGSGTSSAPAAASTSAAAPAQSSSAAPADPASAAPADDGSFVFNGYPMDAADQTISWYSGPSYNPNAAYATADESPFHSGLKEMLGVNIAWQFPTAGTDNTQAFSLLLAAGTYPDIINHNLMKDAERYIDEGTIRDLSPYMDEHAPAYRAWLETDPAYDRAMKTDSGRYYGFGFFREDGGWNDTYLGPVINQTWLDEQGLAAPETIADWDNVLRVFKDKYGAVLSFAKSRVQDSGISGAFGAYSMINLRLYIDNNQKIQLSHIQPEFKELMAKFNEWWKEGLLDQDYYTTDDTAARSNALNLKMGISITSMGQLSNWERDANENNTGAKWVGLQYPKGNDGTLSMVFGGQGIGDVAGTISTSCPEEKIPLVMRALDYAYTDEGNLYWNFGKQGVSWDYDASGKVQYLPLVTEDPNGLNDAIDKYGGSTWSGNCIQATLLLYLKNTETAIAANDLWFYPNEPVTNHWKMPNGITLSADESTRAAELQAPIKTYVEEMAVKYISGEESLDNWDTFVSTVESMNLAELLQINQAGYDRYLAR